MKTPCLFSILLFSFLSFGADIEMKLECFDVVQGELPMGASSLFAFTIQNTTSKPIRLLTNASSWGRSPNWGAHVEGPIDERCLNIGVVVTSLSPVGVLPHLEVPANGTLNLINTGAGAANPGTYTLWVEYYGESAPEGYYQGYVKSNKCSYTIQDPQGVDAEIFNLWQNQNPDRPACEFPLDMEPNILKPQVLIEKYPTSVYAVWAVIASIENPAGAAPAKIFKLIQEGGYPMWNGVPCPESKDGWKRMKGKEFAQWQKEWAEKILVQHPDIGMAPRLKLVRAVMQLILGERENAIESLRAISKTGQDKQSIWAKEFVSLIEKEQKPQAQHIP